MDAKYFRSSLSYLWTELPHGFTDCTRRGAVFCCCKLWSRGNPVFWMRVDSQLSFSRLIDIWRFGYRWTVLDIGRIGLLIFYASGWGATLLKIRIDHGLGQRTELDYFLFIPIHNSTNCQSNLIQKQINLVQSVIRVQIATILYNSQSEH